MERALFVALAASLALAGPALADPHQVKKGDITISNRVVRASIGHSPNSAAYVVIANTGGAPDALVSASCACAAKVEIHKTVMMQGMMMMPEAAPVTIPAHGQVTFRPGGYHVMLEGLKEPLKEGGDQNITLVFQRAGPVTAGFHIRAQISPEGGASMPGMSH
jgi:periplasmic copper chaperone A